MNNEQNIWIVKKINLYWGGQLKGALGTNTQNPCSNFTVLVMLKKLTLRIRIQFPISENQRRNLYVKSSYKLGSLLIFIF